MIDGEVSSAKSGDEAPEDIDGTIAENLSSNSPLVQVFAMAGLLKILKPYASHQ